MTGIPFERVLRNLDTDSVGQGSPSTVTNARLADRPVRPFKVYQLRDSGQFGNEGDIVVGIGGEWQNATTDVTVD